MTCVLFRSCFTKEETCEMLDFCFPVAGVTVLLLYSVLISMAWHAEPTVQQS
jgi:hypothetical protein